MEPAPRVSNPSIGGEGKPTVGKEKQSFLIWVMGRASTLSCLEAYRALSQQLLDRSQALQSVDVYSGRSCCRPMISDFPRFSIT
jgi:hypothetical protein